MHGPLTAPYLLEYTYTRTTGGVVGRFLGALSERRILGARTARGRVIVPAIEYDPETGEGIESLVEVASSGVVVASTWVATPRAAHVMREPFAWVLVRLDGADTALLHVLNAPTRAHVWNGMRVRARWAASPVGRVTDLACFEAEVAS